MALWPEEASRRARWDVRKGTVKGDSHMTAPRSCSSRGGDNRAACARGRGVRSTRPVAVRAVALSVALAGCGGSNVLLVLPPSADPGALGPVQECDAVEQPCKTASVQDTSIYESANTTKLNLPSCPYGIEKDFIRNAGSSNPAALVQCAGQPQASAPDGGIPTTTSGGVLSR